MSKSIVSIFGVCLFVLVAFFIVNQQVASYLKASSFKESEEIKTGTQGAPITKIKEGEAEDSGYFDDIENSNKEGEEESDEIDDLIKNEVNDESNDDLGENLTKYQQKIAERMKQKIKKGLRNHGDNPADISNKVGKKLKTDRFKINVKNRNKELKNILNNKLNKELDASLFKIEKEDEFIDNFKKFKNSYIKDLKESDKIINKSVRERFSEENGEKISDDEFKNSSDKDENGSIKEKDKSSEVGFKKSAYKDENGNIKEKDKSSEVGFKKSVNKDENESIEKKNESAEDVFIPNYTEDEIKNAYLEFLRKGKIRKRLGLDFVSIESFEDKNINKNKAIDKLINNGLYGVRVRPNYIPKIKKTAAEEILSLEEFKLKYQLYKKNKEIENAKIRDNLNSLKKERELNYLNNNLNIGNHFKRLRAQQKLMNGKIELLEARKTVDYKSRVGELNKRLINRLRDNKSDKTVDQLRRESFIILEKLKHKKELARADKFNNKINKNVSSSRYSLSEKAIVIRNKKLEDEKRFRELVRLRILDLKVKARENRLTNSQF